MFFFLVFAFVVVVRAEIPVFPTITAKVTFTAFEWRTDLDSELFTIPSEYREDPGRFPDL